MATAPQFHFIYECGSSYIGVSPTYEVRTVATSVLIKKTITKIFRPLYRIFIKIRKKKIKLFCKWGKWAHVREEDRQFRCLNNDDNTLITQAYLREMCCDFRQNQIHRNVTSAVSESNNVTWINACEKGKSVPLHVLSGPRGFQEVKLPIFRDNGTGLTYRPLLPLSKMLLVLISVRGWVDPSVILRSEGFYVNEMTPSGIETATFGFGAQHLNHCATAVLQRV